MKILKNCQILGLTVASMLVSLPVQALIFFGEDLNTDPGNNSNPPLVPSPHDGVADLPDSDNAQNQFLNSLDDFGLEDFENSPIGEINQSNPIDLTFESSDGIVVNAQLFGDGDGVSQIRKIPFAGTYNTTQELGADQYALIAAFPDNPQEAKILFDQDISAFGFYGTDIGDQDGTLVLDLYDDGVLVDEFFVDVTTPGDLGQGITFTSASAVFVGGSDLGFLFDEVRFDLRAGSLTPPTGDGFGLDNLYIEIENNTPPPTTTPEPSGLIAIGLLGTIGFIFRRNKMRNS